MEFDEVKSEIIKKLQKNAPNLKCPICANKELILIEGFFNRSMQKNMTTSLVVGGPVVPTVALVCSKCGHFIEFSIGVLGLLSKLSDKMNGKSKKKK